MKTNGAEIFRENQGHVSGGLTINGGRDFRRSLFTHFKPRIKKIVTN